MDKKQIKILAIGGGAAILVIVLIVVLVLTLGNGDGSGENTTSMSSNGTAVGDNVTQSGEKAKAQTVIDAIKDENTQVVVEEYPKRIVNVIVAKEDERLEVREDPDTGILNGIELSITYTSETRKEKLVGFYKEIKRIIKACDPSITDERAENIVIRFKQSLPEEGASTSCTETEGAYAFSVSYFPDKAYFVVS